MGGEATSNNIFNVRLYLRRHVKEFVEGGYLGLDLVKGDLNLQVTFHPRHRELLRLVVSVLNNLQQQKRQHYPW